MPFKGWGYVDGPIGQELGILKNRMPASCELWIKRVWADRVLIFDVNTMHYVAECLDTQ